MLRNDLQVGVIAIVRTAAPENFEKIADGWKMSAEERRLLSHAKTFIETYGLRTFSVYDLYEYTFYNQLDEQLAETLYAAVDYTGLIDRFYHLFDKIPEKMPINGDDVMRAGFVGADIGMALKFMRDVWFRNFFLDSREDLLQTLAQYSIVKGIK